MKIKKRLITQSDFATFYKKFMKKRKGRKRVISDRYEICRLQSIIYKTIQEHYLNNEGGVYIDNLGYLCHRIIPHQSFVKSHFGDDISKLGTNGYKYRHECLDFLWMKKNHRSYYHLILSGLLQKRCDRLMWDGLKYKFLYREVFAKMKLFKTKALPVYYGDDLKCRSRSS